MGVLNKIFPPLRRQDGTTLASVMVALGISGIIAMAISRTNDQSMQLTRKMMTRAELESTRKFVRDQFNCSATKIEMDANSAGCAVNVGAKIAIELRNKLDLDVILIDKFVDGLPGTKRGENWEMRAYCVSTPNVNREILVEVRTKPNYRDKNGNYTTDWRKIKDDSTADDGWWDMFDGIPLPCILD